jgi:DNA topoisomerase VI subunit B
MAATLERSTFEMSRFLEFFSEKELQMQIGHPKERWPLALLKELLDNSLDGVEGATDPRGVAVAPRVEVTVEEDSLAVQDNGPGIAPGTVRRSLDYSLRVSSKALYVSPTRGALGNALKCVWAAPFVVDGEQGRAEVVAQGIRHGITVTLDRIAGAPRIEYVPEEAVVKTGTFLRLHWNGVASSLASEFHGPYNGRSLLRAFSTFNPHASFHLADPDGDLDLHASNPVWQKWRPDRPTCPHWYTPENLRALIAAYLAEERAGGRARTVREFVSEFAGLSGTAKAKGILTTVDLSGAWLRDLVSGGDLDLERVEVLLRAMQLAARPVKSKALGILGEEHLARCLVEHFSSDPESVRYKRVMKRQGEGLPFVLEAAFGVKDEDHEDETRDLVVGLNWSPALQTPYVELQTLLASLRIDWHDPVTVLVHLAYPKPGFTDKGKSRLTLSPDVQDALVHCMGSVAKSWKQKKRQADRDDRLQQRDLEEERKALRAERLSITQAAHLVMEEAYLEACDNGEGGTLPANGRQIMYAARPRVLDLTGGRCWKKSSSFTQKMLPTFMAENPELTSSWDVVFDNRGQLTEPHTGRRVDLGTLGVREYIAQWDEEDFGEEVLAPTVDHDYPTVGPRHRYKFVLFVEKQGFDQLLARAEISARYDLPIMSTKGMSVTAARHLVEQLSERGVTILVWRDFDKSGFSIVHTLGADTPRYQFKTKPKVIDLGLRLKDVRALGLATEQVYYDSKKDPRINLRECGATKDECNFLVTGRSGGGWVGQRVELNAMSSAQHIRALEGKLAGAGVTKVVPDKETLAKAFRRATRLVRVEAAIAEAVRELPDLGILTPKRLEAVVRAKIKDTPESWDEAVWQIAREQERKRQEKRPCRRPQAKTTPVSADVPGPRRPGRAGRRVVPGAR